ncbi:hypothetical protein BGZ76_000536 [Entomortierella beljakovae]|nr:hypothetical protein BGZ76_000536 [Entomortierella beljakovae]
MLFSPFSPSSYQLMTKRQSSGLPTILNSLSSNNDISLSPTAILNTTFDPFDDPVSHEAQFYGRDELNTPKKVIVTIANWLSLIGSLVIILSVPSVTQRAPAQTKRMFIILFTAFSNFGFALTNVITAILLGSTIFVMTRIGMSVVKLRKDIKNITGRSLSYMVSSEARAEAMQFSPEMADLRQVEDNRTTGNPLSFNGISEAELARFESFGLGGVVGTEDSQSPGRIATNSAPQQTESSISVNIAVPRSQERSFFAAILRQSLYPVSIVLSGCIQIIGDLTLKSGEHNNAIGYISNIGTSIQGFLFFLVYIYDPAVAQTRWQFRKYWIWKYYIEFYYSLGRPQDGRNFEDQFMEKCKDLNPNLNMEKLDLLTKPPPYSWSIQYDTLAMPSDFQTTHPLVNIASTMSTSTHMGIPNQFHNTVIIHDGQQSDQTLSGRSERIEINDSFSAQQDTTALEGDKQNIGLTFENSNSNNDINMDAVEMDSSNISIYPLSVEPSTSNNVHPNTVVIPPSNITTAATVDSNGDLAESPISITPILQPKEPQSQSMFNSINSTVEDIHDLARPPVSSRPLTLSAPQPGDVLSFPKLTRITTIGGGEYDPRQRWNTTDRVISSRHVKAESSTPRIIISIASWLKKFVWPSQGDNDLLLKEYQSEFKHPKSAYLMHLPCHYDLSQVETSAPFLDRYGGVVFVYDWNLAKDTITEYYRQQYPDGWVKVMPFSLRNILIATRDLDHRQDRYENSEDGTSNHFCSQTNNNNDNSKDGVLRNGSTHAESYSSPVSPWGSCSLLQHDVKKIHQVVFLLTASMNPDYGVFGPMQKQLLEAVKEALPERVGAINVIGHCMLPYTAQDILALYAAPKTGVSNSARSVLVAPSCGSTSILAQKPLIQLLHRLEMAGQWRFIWKLHPSSLQLDGYNTEDTSSSDNIELENVKFVLDNFTVTHEEYACLLPFMEAFDIVITDLHSSVPFIATYFTPKVIISYFNDADYGAPVRHKEFVEQLNTFVQPEELEALLNTLPAPKGDPSFFHSQYGNVDGKEDLRFGNLAGWPTTQIKPKQPLNFRSTTAQIAIEWKNIYKATTKEHPDDIEGANNALGFNAKVALLKGEENITIPKILPRVLPRDRRAAGIELKIMSFNIWNGGLSGGLALKQTAKAILSSGADVVGLQECSTVIQESGLRRYMLPELMEFLPGWYYSDQKLRSVSTGARNPWGPFQLLKIPYGDQPFLETEEEAIQSCLDARGKEMEVILDEIRQVAEQEKDVPILMTGDFNEPSHLDWTPLSVLAGIHPLPVNWPMSEMAYKAGLVDLWRAFNSTLLTSPGSSPSSPNNSNTSGRFNNNNSNNINNNNNNNPSVECANNDSNNISGHGKEVFVTDRVEFDVIERPGFTWTVLQHEQEASDHYDRIDYIYALNRESSPIALKDVAIKMGEEFCRSGEKNEKVLKPWPSDHRAVVATVLL